MKIHILTNDDNFYIINFSILKWSLFFQKQMNSVSANGSFMKPILLQHITAREFECLLLYLQTFATVSEPYQTNNVLQIMTEFADINLQQLLEKFQVKKNKFYTQIIKKNQINI